MFTIQPYNLPDKALYSGQNSGVIVWVPDKMYVILGQRDKPNEALFEEHIKEYNIVVMQRPSGGHSVVLSPNTIVVSMMSRVNSITEIKSFFRDCNMKIINALQLQGVENLSIQGISDIVINDKKIAGSSMYKAKEFLFFHAVINLSEKTEVIAKFLKHPTTEPDYRNKRDHLHFVSSLIEQGHKINVESFTLDIYNSNNLV